jgi:2-methylisocitrate lyase-like PEP mutase family enzyme
LKAFVENARGPVNVLGIPPAPSFAELGELGVARLSYGSLLHGKSVEQFTRLLESIPGGAASGPGIASASD